MPEPEKIMPEPEKFFAVLKDNKLLALELDAYNAGKFLSDFQGDRIVVVENLKELRNEINKNFPDEILKNCLRRIEKLGLKKEDFEVVAEKSKKIFGEVKSAGIENASFISAKFDELITNTVDSFKKESDKKDG